MANTLAILRLPAVKALVGLSRSTIYQRAAAGTFPRPVVLGPKSVGWRAADVEAWLEARPETTLKTRAA